MDKTITITWSDVFYDARANTWKTGAVMPEEDGSNAERQMDDAGVDSTLAKRSTLEAIQKLIESVKRFMTGESGTTTGPTTISGIVSNSTWTIVCAVSDRNNATASELSGLAHAIVVAHVCADWFKMINSNLEKTWYDKMEEAELRLRTALYKKLPPTLA